MLELIFAQVEGVAKSWERDVEKRRLVTAVDPVADTIAYCASEVKKLVEQLKDDTQLLTPAEFAGLHGASQQTVTTWIRMGKIPARKTGRGWKIPRSAEPPRRRAAVTRREAA